MATPKDKFDDKGREKVQCKVCGLYFHRLDVHISKKHDMNVEQYQEKYPGSPTISVAASKAASKALTPKKEKVNVPEPETDDVFKIGVARLEQRKDLTEDDRHHIPQHDPNYNLGNAEKEMWEYIALGVQDSENVFISGPTGCGKSMGVLQLAAALDQPVQRINLHGEVRAADFVGDKTVEVDSESGQAVVIWKDGILPDAMRKGHWLLLDELDAAPAHVLFVLQAVLEKGMRLVLSANNGEVVKAHKHFRLIATANTLGRGDETGLYGGTNILNEAFLDRFGIVILANYPDQKTEKSIITDRTGINRSDASKMVQVACDVRKAASTETVYCSFSTRRLVSWAQASVRLGDIKRALKISVTNRLSSEDALFIEGLVQRYWG